MEAQLSHREAKGLFLAAVDEALVERDELRLRDHLERCDDCRAGYERYARTVRRVQHVQREKAPSGLSKMILRRARRRRQFGRRALQWVHAQQRVPVEAIIPVLLGVLVAALLILAAP